MLEWWQGEAAPFIFLEYPSIQYPIGRGSIGGTYINKLLTWVRKDGTLYRGGASDQPLFYL